MKKIQLLVGVHKKTNIKGVIASKRELGQSAGLRGELAKRGVGVFEGRLIPQCTL